MLTKAFVLQFVSLFIMTISLTQCANVSEPFSQPIVKLEQGNHYKAPFTQPASAYLAQAKNQAENESLMLKAAGRFIEDGQWRDGIQILAKTAERNEEQKNIKNILLAKTDLMREQPKLAITHLAKVQNISQNEPYYRLQYHDTLARAYEAVHNSAEAVTERIKLEHLIPNESARLENRRILWQSLTHMPNAELNTLVLENSDQPELQGWMKLALISRQQENEGEKIFAELEQWQSQYSNHPANFLLPSPLATIKPYLHSKPKQVALLLPMTGPLAGPGGAIRDGFIAASDNTSTKVVIYDTGKGNVRELYNQAIEEGADCVVGPLTKNEVAAVATLTHPVPTILLNDTESANSNAYQFGLSPSNEAKQVAIKAGKKGFKRALIISPEGSWGEEITNAFIAQWRSNGGVAVDKLAYGNSQNLNEAVRDLLHITASQTREKQLKQLLGSAIQTMPSRRQDFDMIFLLAYPSKARQIMPLLKYYFVGNIPVYATSTVYSGNPNVMKDKDLDGIIFSDMPWIFSNQIANKNWPEQWNSYNRLYALGMDSFALTRQLNQLILFPAMGINDKSGILYLNKKQQIARIPAWGQFKGGVAIHLS